MKCRCANRPSQICRHQSIDLHSCILTCRLQCSPGVAWRPGRSSVCLSPVSRSAATTQPAEGKPTVQPTTAGGWSHVRAYQSPDHHINCTDDDICCSTQLYGLQGGPVCQSHRISCISVGRPGPGLIVGRSVGRLVDCYSATAGRLLMGLVGEKLSFDNKS